MKPDTLKQARNPLLQGAWAAMQRAAKRAREIARQSRTALVIVEDGKLKSVYPHLVQPDAAKVTKSDDGSKENTP